MTATAHIHDIRILRMCDEGVAAHIRTEGATRTCITIATLGCCWYGCPRPQLWQLPPRLLHGKKRHQQQVQSSLKHSDNTGIHTLALTIGATLEEPREESDPQLSPLRIVPVPYFKVQHNKTLK